MAVVAPEQLRRELETVKVERVHAAESEVLSKHGPFSSASLC